MLKKKTFFVGLLGISEKMLLHVIEKGRMDTVLTNSRGTNVPSNKTPDEKLEKVMTHINSLPLL